MATTLTNLPVTRWTVTGASRPQPLAGTVDRAREAYETMCAEEWRRSADDAAIPAHDYVATSPVAGDAYRQTWGYDAAARTERSATGAVCYSVKIPSDALTGEACSVVSVFGALVGDRWLDGGAIVSAIVSASATPPAFSDFLAASATTEAMLVPTPAVKPEGAPANWRNLRADATGTFALDVDAASDAWLHICLRVADYLFVYGSWHDGGAMLDPSTIAVTFSRDVAADAPSGTPLDIGRLAADGPGADYALAHLPLASVWINWSFVADNAAFSGLEADDEAKVRNLLSYIYNSPGLYDGNDRNVFADSATNLGKSGAASVMTAGMYGFCALVSHGIAAGRTYSGLTLENPINPPGAAAMPYRLLAYAVAPMNVFGSAPSVATPVPWWGDIISGDFRDGRARSVRCLASPADVHGERLSAVDQSSGACATVSVTPLARLDVTGTLSEIPFAAPFRAGELVTVLLALVPIAAPTLPAVSETFDVTVTRETSGFLDNDGVAAATCTGSYATQGDDDSVTVDFCLGRAHHINSWPHVPGVTTKNGNYVWASQKNVEWTDYPSLEFELAGNVTIAHGDVAGTYRWHTAPGGSPGSVSYNYSPSTRVAVEWEWFYLGFYSGYDLARLYGHISRLDDVPIQLVKLDGNGDPTGTVYDGTINLANVSLWVGVEFADSSKFPPGHVVYPYDFKTNPPVAAFAQEGDLYTYGMKYPTGAMTYGFANSTLNADAQAHIKVSGTATVTKDGVAYTAPLPELDEDIPFTITYKTGGTWSVDDTPDLSYLVKGNYTLPARQHTLLFRSADGVLLPLVVSLPARLIYCNEQDSPEPLERYVAPSAKSFYLARYEAWNKWSDIISGGATMNGKGLAQTIDVGLVTLHE